MTTSDQSSVVPVPAEPAVDYHFRYTVQKGFFMQSEDETDDKSFDFVRYIFCLLFRVLYATMWYAASLRPVALFIAVWVFGMRGSWLMLLTEDAKFWSDQSFLSWRGRG
jgi:hypothetical protein